MLKKAPLIRFNHQIEANSGIIKLIDNNTGEFIGEMSLREAIQKAFAQNLDLVQISNENMPVCKICDYNKYKYELIKKNKQKNKNNKPIQLKTIKFSINIDLSHLELKIKQAQEFLEDGCKVSFSTRLRGREVMQQDVAIKFFQTQIIDRFKPQWTIDKGLNHTGREISVIIIGKKLNNNKDIKDKDVKNTEENDTNINNQ